MKCYDPQTKEIFEVTPEEWKQAQDDYISLRQQDLSIFGRAPAIFTPVGPVLKGHTHWIHKLDEEYTMIKFEDKYVHFRWSDELVGKKCFVADSLADLEEAFKAGDAQIVQREHDKEFPFYAEKDFYKFCYYDPNLEYKKAFNEGQQIQVKSGKSWYDIHGEPSWSEDSEYRIKPAGLQWTDLEVGDVLESTQGHHRKVMVTEIDFDDNVGSHIYVGYWLTDKELQNWTKS